MLHLAVELSTRTWQEQLVKIAVATMDGILVSQHFGQSKGFVVFETNGADVGSREFRTNNHTPHAQGLCNHDGAHEHATHSHGNILELLKDCTVVLCGGMGGGAAQALRSHGIEPIILATPSSADEAAAAYLNGTLTTSQTGLCNCHH
jgi:predicted Fe-Mo cluster-binding NifX family protein